MNAEFHYYTIYFLAVKAGFLDNEAEIIASSSQMVDSNVLFFEIDTPRGRVVTEPTQNYGYWEETTLERIYLPFHFFPGDPELGALVRKDKNRNPLTVTPNSPGAKELLVRALNSKSLYRIGIALHTFADTWAHQNFSGKLETWNALDENNVAPSVGHAQAGRQPDIWTETWTDPRLENFSIINRLRFREAAGKIYRYLAIFRGKDFKDEEIVLNQWETLMEKGRYGKTLEDRMIEFLLFHRAEPYDRRLWLEEATYVREGGWDDEGLFEGYDKLLWLMDRFLFTKKIFKKEPLKAKPGFETSHFWRWHLAAGEHREEAWNILDQQLKNWRQLVK